MSYQKLSSYVTHILPLLLSLCLIEFISDLWKEVHGGHIVSTKEIRTAIGVKITTETRAVADESLER